MVMKKYDDILDFLVEREEEVLSGTYYNRMPETTQDVGIPFNYDIVNEKDRRYSTILGNIRADGATSTIKTNDHCGFKINGYIATQDGSFWQVAGLGKHLVKPETKQALRLLKESAETEYVLSLIEVDNPWGIK
jgi:hypothetical protein